MNSEGGLLAFYFFNDTATTEIYTLSLHDALPISNRSGQQADTDATRHLQQAGSRPAAVASFGRLLAGRGDRKSTRLNSSHMSISYAVFCLKKKNDSKMTSRDVIAS